MKALNLPSAFKFILHYASELLDHKFLKKLRGALSVQELCKPRDRNQSINPRPRQRSGAALIHWTSRPRLQPITLKKKKKKHTLCYPTMLGSSLQTSSSWGTRETDTLTPQHDGRSYRRCSKRRVAWDYHTHGCCLSKASTDLLQWDSCIKGR